MLNLSRKCGEAIHVDGPSTIIVKRLIGSRVLIGVAASRDVRILRGELVDEALAASVDDRLESLAARAEGRAGHG